MRRLSSWMAVAIVAALGTTTAGGAELLAPVRGTVLTLDIGGHQSTYYRLWRDSTLQFAVSGPGLFKAIVRLGVPADLGDDTVGYRVVVTEKSDTARDVTTTSSMADAEWIGENEVPTLLRKFSFLVPEGAHTYDVRFYPTKGRFAGLRVFLKRRSPHAGESPLYPVAMDRMLTLIYREKRIDYHLATTQKPVKVRVIGPTRLRMVSRLAYGPTMKGTQKYALGIQLDGKALKPEKLSTTKAINSEFEEENTWVPGKSRTVYVVIPAGEHVVTITPGTTDAPGVALRFTIPAEDVTRDADD